MKRDHNTLPRDAGQALFPYLVGLWEGDGHITLPKHDATGRLKSTPALHITFARVNLPLVRLLVQLWGGWIRHKRGDNALVWTVTRGADLFALLVRMEPYLRTPKAYEFNLLLEYMRKRPARTPERVSPALEIGSAHANVSPLLEPGCETPEKGYQSYALVALLAKHSSALLLALLPFSKTLGWLGL